jgi:hypothetical protein
MSFYSRQSEYKVLHGLMTDWVSKSARLLWYRTHHFVYAQFAPSVARTSQETTLIAECTRYDRMTKNAWSHRVRSCRVLMDEVRRLTAQGLLDSRVLLDPAFLVLPPNEGPYSWIPDLRPGAPSIDAQLATLDRNEPWRIYYVDQPRLHPTYLHRYDEILDNLYDPERPLPLLEPPADDKLKRLLRRKIPVPDPPSKSRATVNLADDSDYESESKADRGAQI